MSEDDRMAGQPIELLALDMASVWHAGQERKAIPGGPLRPYIVHPVDVARRLARFFPEDPVLLSAAYLHDVVEDCQVPILEVERIFGPEIAALVEEVTDPEGLSKKEAKNRQIRLAPTMSHRAKLLKLADKASNVADILRNPPPWPEYVRRQYVESCRKFVRAAGGVHGGLEAEFWEMAGLVPEP